MHRISSPHDREITALRGYIEAETPNRFSAKPGQNPTLLRKQNLLGTYAPQSLLLASFSAPLFLLAAAEKLPSTGSQQF